MYRVSFLSLTAIRLERKVHFLVKMSFLLEEDNN